MKFTPRDYQQAAVAHLLRHPKAGLAAGMGTGKSAVTLTTINRLRLVEDVCPVLILAPKRVCITTWPDEVAKWDDFRHLKISVVVGTEEERYAALTPGAHLYVMNYENVPWLLKQQATAWPYRMVVADESTKLKAHDAVWFKGKPGYKEVMPDGRMVRVPPKPGLAHMARITPRWINLSGTPAPNGLQDLWSQTYLLDQGERLGHNITAFRDRWFRRDRTGFKYEPLPHAEPEIHAALKDLWLTIKAEDYLDLPPLVENVVRAPLPEPVMRAYRQMQKTFLMHLRDGTVEAANAAVLSGKLLQAANGAMYHDDQTWEEIHAAKIQALEDVIEEAAGAPVLVAYQFKSDLARLQAHFKTARVLDANPQTLLDWNAGRIPVLLAHPASAGHGLNLQDGGCILAFFGLTWNLEHHDQIIERIGPTRQVQAGHPRTVFVHYIVAPGTVDELVMKRIKTKKSVQDIFLEAMKEQA